MGEIQTISYVGVSDVSTYPDMDNDQYNIRRFKNYCFNNEFLCHFEYGNITPGGIPWGKTPNYLVRTLTTTTPITPNTKYTFISYHRNPTRQLKVYCNGGANLVTDLVAEFPLGNNGISYNLKTQQTLPDPLFDFDFEYPLFTFSSGPRNQV